MALKNFNTFPLLEEYLNYLTVIKGRSPNTVVEYRTDILMFFSYLKEMLESHPFLQKQYRLDDGIFTIFYIDDMKAVLNGFSGESEKF